MTPDLAYDIAMRHAGCGPVVVLNLPDRLSVRWAAMHNLTPSERAMVCHPDSQVRARHLVESAVAALR